MSGYLNVFVDTLINMLKKLNECIKNTFLKNIQQ